MHKEIHQKKRKFSYQCPVQVLVRLQVGGGGVPIRHILPLTVTFSPGASLPVTMRHYLTIHSVHTAIIHTNRLQVTITVSSPALSILQ